MRFLVKVDGKPPGDSYGADTDAAGNGAITQTRLYQLVRQAGQVGEHTFEIRFLDAKPTLALSPSVDEDDWMTTNARPRRMSTAPAADTFNDVVDTSRLTTIENFPADQADVMSIGAQ